MSTLPDSFRDGDDAHIDVSAPLVGRGQYMNQSFISMIANVGSNANARARFGVSGGRGDGAGQMDSREPPASLLEVQEEEQDALGPPSSLHMSSRFGKTTKSHYFSHLPGDAKGKQMFGSLPTLTKPKTSRQQRNLASIDEQMSTSQILVPLTEDERKAQLTAANQSENEHTTSASNSEDEASREWEDDAQIENLEGDGSAEESLAMKVAKVFGLDSPEDIVAVYPCWLLQSVLLQGYMYVTSMHICFYAYLPKKTSTVAKSGYLSKRGQQTRRFRRSWFVLKGDILSYFTNAHDLYFPRGHIDMRRGISAELLSDSDKAANAMDFVINTPQRNHYFRADSASSAKEWVKALQKVIFRSRNDSDSVKILFPIDNILDIEDNPVMDFADTFRVRVVDNDETFAIDEYFFSFFANGQDALTLLRTKVESNTLNQSAATAKRDGGFVKTPMVPKKDRAPKQTKTKEQVSEADLAASRILSSSDIFLRPTVRTPTEANPSPLKTADRQESDAEEGTRTPHKDLPKRATDSMQKSSSSSTLNELLRVGAYPIQRASGLAGYLGNHSKRLGYMLAAESKEYLQKVSSMWAGQKMHYGSYNDLNLDEEIRDPDDEDKSVNPIARFRNHFALPTTEKLQASYYAYLHRLIPVYGKIYIGNRKLCFRSLLPGTRTKMILPFRDIENVDKENGFRFGYSGLVLSVRGHEELFFEFSRADARDDCAITILRTLESLKQISESRMLSKEEKKDIAAASAENNMLQDARRVSSDAESGNESEDQGSHRMLEDAILACTRLITDNKKPDIHASTILFDDAYASIVDFKPPKSMKITCLTIGSRGDIQPYIALCKGLIAEGHSPTIATHEEFRPWIEHHGIRFAPVAGDPTEIMRLCIENDMFTYSFLKEASSRFRGWIDDLLVTSWKACQGCDLLIESPSAMGGIHIAEALQVPYFRAFTMPWTRTRAYPHAFAVPSQKMGGNYNTISYVMFDNVFWQATAGQINRWRRNTLNLPSTTLDKLQISKVPFLYNFSPSVVVPPLDFNHWVRITGFWFLDEGTNYKPDPALEAFIAKARRDRKKIVYVGFGSMVVENPAALTRSVVDSVVKADVRCILSKGWSDRWEPAVKQSSDPSVSATTAEFPLPSSVHLIKSAPHDWLFKQIDAAAHHGGSGTTGASLRAGIPTICKPFFGDQFFFGQRVEDLGVGLCLNRLNTSVFSRALWRATNDERMIVKARKLGEQIRAENGVETAIQAIYRDLEYAKSLIKRPLHSSSNSPTLAHTRDRILAGDGSEDSWTLLEQDSREEEGEATSNDDRYDRDDDDGP